MERMGKEVKRAWGNSDDMWSFNVEDVKFLYEEAVRAQKKCRAKTKQ